MCSNKTKELYDYLEKRNYTLDSNQYLQLCHIFTNIREIKYNKDFCIFFAYIDDGTVIGFEIK